MPVCYKWVSLYYFKVLPYLTSFPIKRLVLRAWMLILLHPFTLNRWSSQVWIYIFQGTCFPKWIQWLIFLDMDCSTRSVKIKEVEHCKLYKLSSVVKAQTMLHEQIVGKSLILESPLKCSAAFCHIYTLL